jgi:ABC-type branched-subunit amino acid transport system ATPase component
MDPTIDNTVAMIPSGFARIESVTTKKGKFILNECYIDFPEGAVTCILGPTGSGKTTLLNTITDNMLSNVKAVAEGMYFFFLAAVYHARVCPSPSTMRIQTTRCLNENSLSKRVLILKENLEDGGRGSKREMAQIHNDTLI